jgi:hypothetical protein
MKQQIETFKVEHWNSAYKGAPSVLQEVQDWPYTKESFELFYQKNNRLRYCNGCHYSIVDPEIQKEYVEFHKGYNTISNYYGGGVVD